VTGFTTEFVNRFSEAVENIILKVPLISNESLQNLEMSVLFSGGVDSLMVALSVGDVLFKLAKTPLDGNMFNGKIRLYTVSFGEKEEVDLIVRPHNFQLIVLFAGFFKGI
jgi:asparagine synthetase B (glutamine-hydrolysing)